MMAQTREQPWWASEDPAGIRDDTANGHGHHQRPAWWDAYEALGQVARDLGSAVGGDGGETDDSDGEGAEHVHTGTVEACRICPVCALIRVVGDARPELVGHLAEAARHLALAARTMLDAQASGQHRDTGLQRIVLDDE